MFRIDILKRQVIIMNDLGTRDVKIINEFDRIQKKFLPNTVDKYECELVLLEVPTYNAELVETGKETKAFARRVGYENWLMKFNEEDYIL